MANPSEKKPANEKAAEKKFVIIRARAGTPNPKARRTLEILKLMRVNHCVLMPENPSVLGMLLACKDYICWGNPSEDTIKKLLEWNQKRGLQSSVSSLGGKPKAQDSKPKTQDLAGKTQDPLKQLFRLHPPRKGWKSVKRPYPQGGLGKRPDMDKLISRML